MIISYIYEYWYSNIMLEDLFVAWFLRVLVQYCYQLHLRVLVQHYHHGGFVDFTIMYWYSIEVWFIPASTFYLCDSGFMFDLLRGDLWNFDLISNNKMVHKFIWPSLQQTSFLELFSGTFSSLFNPSFLSHFMMAPNRMAVCHYYLWEMVPFSAGRPILLPPIRFLISSSRSSKRLSLS